MINNVFYLQVIFFLVILKGRQIIRQDGVGRPRPQDQRGPALVEQGLRDQRGSAELHAEGGLRGAVGGRCEHPLG